jgi:hypothetical protein
VPLDEVLAFRKEFGTKHQRYARSVRKFAYEVSTMTPAQRKLAFKDRQGELNDMAAALRNTARRAWGKPSSFLLSMAGSVVSAIAGNPLSAVLSAGAAITGRIAPKQQDTGAFSYIFAAQDRFGHRW